MKVHFHIISIGYQIYGSLSRDVKCLLAAGTKLSLHWQFWGREEGKTWVRQGTIGMRGD